MSHRPQRPRFRALSVEPLEPRAVPAGMVHQFTLPPEFVTSQYSSTVVASGEILVSGTRNDKPAIVEMNDSGEVTGTIELGLPEGRDAGSVVAISDNGQWALGQCRLAGVWDVPVLTVIWKTEDPAHPRVVDALTGVTDLLPSPLDERASVADDGSFVFNSFKLGINLVHSDGTVQKVPLPFDSNPISPSNQQVRAVSNDGRVMVGFDAPGGVLIWNDLTPAELSIAAPAVGGDAEAISEDGRVAGGLVAANENGVFKQEAALWIDGRMQILRDAAGNPLEGIVDYILPQGGSQPGWTVIGRTFGVPGFDGRFIAFVDSSNSDATVALPFNEFIRQQSGTDDPVSIPTVYNVEVRGDSLYVFAAVIPLVTVPIGRIGCLTDSGVLDDDRRLPATDAQCIPPLAADMKSQDEGAFSGVIYVVPLGTAGQDTSALPLDVNADGQISPADALMLINAINGQGAIGDSARPGSPVFRLDLNRDGYLSAGDVLIIVNRLNGTVADAPTTSAPDSAEGEPSTANITGDIFTLAADQLFTDLAAKRRK